MPSGRTHDQITLWSLPLVAGVAAIGTGSGGLALLTAGGFLFSGMMFGPDLDIQSRQYKRWGMLRWIWLPYRQAVRHRSLLSHGPIIGTLGRVLYLGLWISLVGLLVLVLGAIVAELCHQSAQWQQLTNTWLTTSGTTLYQSLIQNRSAWLAVLVGLELGAMSHACSDWVGSAWKRAQKRRRG